MDIVINKTKLINIRKAIIPFFPGQTALTIFFGHYGFDHLDPLVWEIATAFYGFVFNKISKKKRFCYG